MGFKLFLPSVNSVLFEELIIACWEKSGVVLHLLAVFVHHKAG